jgi:glycerate kinase
MGETAASAGWRPELVPLSDGGEGFLDALAVMGGELRQSEVTGPVGTPVLARWRIGEAGAVIESAQASGLALVGGPAGNDPVAASSRGTGELVVEAIAAGAGRVLVGVGGSASTDGGLGAVEVVGEAGGLGGADVVVACDVRIRFVEAAERFGPQKGASAAQVSQLRRRLEELAARYRRDYGLDVAERPGSGAAGGLAGGLAALGARLVPGFDVVAGAVGLAKRLARAELVLGAEGRLDASSWEGKVVGGLAGLASGVAPMGVVAGSVGPGGLAGAEAAGVEVVVLEDRFGLDAALGEPAACLARATAELLERLGRAGP